MAWNLWIVAVIWLTAAALPAEPSRLSAPLTNEVVKNSIIEEAILSLLERLREDMVTGAGAVPVLDPLYLEHLQVTGDDYGLPGSYIDIKDLNVNKLSTFSVDQLTVSLTSIILQRYRLIMDITFPRIDLSSDKYNLALQVLGYSIFGDGRLGLSVLEPRVRANILVGISLSTSGVFVNIRESEVHFDLAAFESKITGLFNNEIANDFANRFLAYLVPDLVKEYQDEITATLSQLVLEVGNEILKDINIIGIIGSLYIRI